MIIDRKITPCCCSEDLANKRVPVTSSRAVSIAGWSLLLKKMWLWNWTAFERYPNESVCHRYSFLISYKDPRLPKKTTVTQCTNKEATG